MTCPKQDREIEAVVLHRVGFLEYSCPKDFKPSVAPYTQTWVKYLHPGVGGSESLVGI